MTDWDGHERRAENLRFDRALADVRDLKGATTDLAEAVKIKTDTIHRIMVRLAFMLAAFIVVDVVSSALFVAGLNRHMDRGHDRIVCQLNLTPEQKTALGSLACTGGGR